MPDTRKRVALVDADAGGEGGAARLMLEDFADALRAYARMGGAEPPETLWLEPGEPAWGGRPDALVIAFRLRGGTLPERVGRAADAAPGGAVPSYALCCTDGFDAADALPALDALATRCGAGWRGGVSAGGGALVPLTARSPRMGTLRRWRSEAVDALVAAVRMGVGVEEAAALTRDETRRREGGVILARCPLPRPVYRLVGRLAERPR